MITDALPEATKILNLEFLGSMPLQKEAFYLSSRLELGGLED